MAIGTWDDFTSKFGFGDGATAEQRDFWARDALVDMLNKRWPAMRAEGYDRPGVHNPVLILVEGEEPEDLYEHINEMIILAYNEADRRLIAEAPKEWRPRRERRPPKG